MRKAITILLALVMVLSLAACGGGSTTTETPAATGEPTPESEPTASIVEEPKTLDLKTAVVGKWVYQPGPLSDFYMELYKGGSGAQFNYKGEKTFDLTWEIEDDVINISMGRHASSFTGYTLENDTLTSVDGSQIFKKDTSSGE